jgi:hypothetical protein
LCEKILKENDGLGFSLVEFSIPSSSNLYVQLSTREALNTDIGIEEDPRSVESASFPAFHDARSRTSDDTMSKAKKKINGIAINPYKSYISVISVCVYIKTAAASPHGARMCAPDIIPVPVRFLPHSLTKTRASRRPRCLPPRVSNPPIKQAMDETLFHSSKASK